MNDNKLLLKVSERIDCFLYEIQDEYKLRNVEWEVFSDNEKNEIEIYLEDFGTGGSIKTSIDKEDIFCATMIAGKDKHHTIFEAVGGLITATLLNNLAMAGIKSLSDIYTEKDLKFFFNRFKKREE